jgi:hypothetical protein
MVITLNKNRIFSALLAALYVGAGFVMGGGEGGSKVFLFVILPLACIWFGEAMGGYTGPAAGMPITSPSPGLFVCIAGWILLLLPIVMGIIVYIIG